MPIEVDLEAGIVALALSHCGIIDWSCDGCEGLRQQDLHCSGESEYPLFEWNEHEWYSCPLKWLSPQVYSWYDEYSYYEVYPSSAPAYNDVNTTYSTTRGAIDDFLSSAGSKFDINAAGANKQLGTLSRRVLSNAQSRVQVLNSLDNLQTVAESLGGKFDDDLITQIAFINEIETLFGSSAKTSLQGSTEKAIKTGASVANRLRKAEGLGGLALDTVASGIEKAGGVNEENLIKALRAILTS